MQLHDCTAQVAPHPHAGPVLGEEVGWRRPGLEDGKQKGSKAWGSTPENQEPFQWAPERRAVTLPFSELENNVTCGCMLPLIMNLSPGAFSNQLCILDQFSL